MAARVLIKAAAGAALLTTAPALADTSGDVTATGVEAPADRPRPNLIQFDADIVEADLRRHVAALTHPVANGRLTGTPGAAAAGAYVAEMFAGLGLEPAGDDGGYFQAFAFTAGVSLGTDNTAAVDRDGATRPLAIGVDWTPLGFAQDGPVDAMDVAFAGFGVQAPAGHGQSAFDSYAGEDVDGGWVLILQGAPDDVAPALRRHLSAYAGLRFKVSAAKAMGAQGVIVAAPPGRGFSDGLPKLAFNAASGGAQIPVIAVNAATRDALLAGIDLAATNSGETGAPAPLEGIAISATIDLDEETRVGRNILARLPADVSAGRGAVVIGGHVDHLGVGGSGNSLARGDEIGQVHVGADDNASGVAAMLEIAQRMAARKTAGSLDLQRDVIFAAWSGEEIGLLGSTHYIGETLAANDAETLDGLVSVYLNMDMVGRLDGSLQLMGLGSSPVWAGEIERRNAVVGLPIETSNDVYLPTDATPFYLNGAPILSAFTGAHGDYHTPRDTVDKLNFEGLTDVATLMALIAGGRASDAEDPEYLEVPRRQSAPGGAMRSGGIFLGTIPKYAQDGVVGVAISGTVQGGPAETAGLRGDDVVVGLAGEEVGDIYDYMRALTSLKAGEETQIVVERAGERVELTITPGVRE